jgi:PTH2 family peptidyl-tRNA hydrolase
MLNFYFAPIFYKGMSSFKFKQCIVVREDLKMSNGKTCVQVAHAAVSAAEETRRLKPEWFTGWFEEGQKKVVLKVKTLDELVKLKEAAACEGIPAYLVSDMGLTELPPGTVTCLGIGPAPEDLMNRVTGGLPLL